MEKKMYTRKSALATVIAMESVKADKELHETLSRMLEVESRVKKESPKQIENRSIAENVVSYFSANSTPLTIGEMLELNKQNGFLGEINEPMNNQRLSRICKNLVDEGRMQKLIERRVSLFTVAE